MGLERNIAIKNYINSLFTEDQAVRKIKTDAANLNVPDIHVPSNVGRLIHCLAKIKGAKRILEIGTLVGYSTAWLAKALPVDGKLVTLEKIDKHAHIARENLQQCQLDHLVDIKVGEASDLLLEMIKHQVPSFDLIFIDADKANYPLYLDLALKLSKVGTLILSDNLIPRSGPIGHALDDNDEAKGIYRFNEKMAAHPELESVFATTIVGDKGRVDALGIAIVTQ